MNDHPVHRDDIKALRREGDLRAYLTDLINAGRTQRDTKPTPVPTPRPGRRPGQWPQGSEPPGPPPDWDHPPEAWAEAVRRYRTDTRSRLDEEENP